MARNTPMRGITIQDVAKAAGVSPSSVSNFLNGRNDQMRPETLERIRASIAELGYAPNVVARQLKTGRTPMLGLLVPSVANAYHGELAEALDAAAQARGFRLILGNGHSDAGREQAFIEEMVGYGVQGIVVACEQKQPELLRGHVEQGVAFVLFDERAAELSPAGMDVVNVHNARATAMAVEHLAALGHRRIAYVTPRPQTASRQARLRGYTEALARLDLAAPQVLSEDADSLRTLSDADPARLADYAASIIAESRPRPTAVVALNDTLAIALLARLREQGLRVPEDISVVGVDDIRFATLTAPALSTLRPPYADMAAAAIDCLQSRLAQPGRPGRQHIFPPELVARASSAAV